MSKFLFFILISIYLTSCQSVKDGLTGTKRNNSDEFLIEKKNPLIQPPEFGKLPSPENTKKKKDDQNFNEVEELLKKSQSSNNESISSSETSSVEKLILEKIKN